MYKFLKFQEPLVRIMFRARISKSSLISKGVQAVGKKSLLKIAIELAQCIIWLLRVIDLSPGACSRETQTRNFKT